jgi:thioredoxin 1
MAGSVLEFNDANFKSQVLDSAEPTLVDFWAPWCEPCLRLSPTIEALATQYAGKIRVGKLNTDDNQQTSIEYQISGIPCVMLFVGGKPVERLIGLLKKVEFERAIDKHVGAQA